MNTEERYILQILSDFIFERPSEKPSEELDWMDLYNIASNHEIGGIVFFQCKSFIPNSAIELFRSSYSATMFFHANRKTLRDQVVNALTDKGIPHFTIKGAHVASYYPNPALRTSGDIDLVVHPEDRDKVYDMLVDMGFTPPYKKTLNEWKIWKNNIELELHSALVYKSSHFSQKQYDFFYNCWNYVENNTLNINFHFVFLIIHIYKHFKTTGLGIRQFIDIAIMAHNPKGLDFNWIEKKLFEIDLIDFAKTVFALNERLFGVTPPLDSSNISDQLFNKSIRFIFNSGVFGKHNSDFIKLATINSLMSGKSKYSLLREHIFPDYSSLSNSSEYRWLEGKRYLLPVAWIKRYGNILKKRGIKSSCKNFADNNVSKKGFQERIDFLNAWGIKTYNDEKNDR